MYQIRVLMGTSPTVKCEADLNRIIAKGENVDIKVSSNHLLQTPDLAPVVELFEKSGIHGISEDTLETWTSATPHIVIVIYLLDNGTHVSGSVPMTNATLKGNKQ